MLESLLPSEVVEALQTLDEKNVYEIRIRDGKKIKINYFGKYIALSNGRKTITAEFGLCAKIMTKACDFSLYSVNNQIIQGFVTVENGVRIGLCGEIVRENNGIKTVKNFNSLNIRIPHDVVNCSNTVFSQILCAHGIYNTLIVSSPGKGKTTMLRDLSRKLSRENINVLIVDERNEICAVNGGKAYYDIGENCDIITFGGKDFAFSYGIRTMAPDVIITDELMTIQDVSAIQLAMAGGVKVIASVHAGDIDDLQNKNYLKELILSKSVDRFFILSAEEIGKLQSVYDKNLRRI